MDSNVSGFGGAKAGAFASGQNTKERDEQSAREEKKATNAAVAMRRALAARH